MLNLAWFPQCGCDACLWLLVLGCPSSWVCGTHTDTQMNMAQLVHSGGAAGVVMDITAKGRSVRMFNEYTDALLLFKCPGQELLGQSSPRTRLKRKSETGS